MEDQQILLEKLCEGRDTEAYRQALTAIYIQYKPSIIPRLMFGYFQLSEEQADEQYLAAITIFEHKVLKGTKVTNIEAFLWGIARNKARDFVKSEARRQEKQRSLQTIQPTIELPDDTLHAETCRRIYHETLSPLLGKSCHDILLLKAKGYKAPEIAKKLGYTSQNQATVVRVSIYKCQKKLIKIIETRPKLKETLQELFQ